jgi:uncharacterized protein YhdP
MLRKVENTLNNETGVQKNLVRLCGWVTFQEGSVKRVDVRICCAIQETYERLQKPR